jgi:hypothetical protein
LDEAPRPSLKSKSGATFIEIEPARQDRARRTISIIDRGTMFACNHMPRFGTSFARMLARESIAKKLARRLSQTRIMVYCLASTPRMVSLQRQQGSADTIRVANRTPATQKFKLSG